MVRKRFGALSEHVECFLRRMCGALSPASRLIVVLTMLTLFTVLSLYFTVSSVCRFGQGTDDAMRCGFGISSLRSCNGSRLQRTV